MGLLDAFKRGIERGAEEGLPILIQAGAERLASEIRPQVGGRSVGQPVILGRTQQPTVHSPLAPFARTFQPLGGPMPNGFPTVRPASLQDLGQTAMELAGLGCATPTFRTRGTRVSPAPIVIQPHPETGEPVFFGHLGRPLLFSRDLAAARKVARLASRARRRTVRKR